VSSSLVGFISSNAILVPLLLWLLSISIVIIRDRKNVEANYERVNPYENCLLGPHEYVCIFRPVKKMLAQVKVWQSFGHEVYFAILTKRKDIFDLFKDLGP